MNMIDTRKLNMASVWGTLAILLAALKGLNKLEGGE